MPFAGSPPARTVTGSAGAFLLAVLVILTWAVTGPLFNFSDGLAADDKYRNDHRYVSDGLPHSDTQNRDSVAIQLKLDELLRGVVGARTSLVDLENLSDEDLALLHQQFARLQVSAAKSEQDAAKQVAKDAAVDGRKDMDPA